MLMRLTCGCLTGIVFSSFSLELVAAEPSMAGGVDRSVIPVAVERAFPNITIDRPVVLTNAGDGTDRVFVAGQKGKIYFFKNDQSVEQPTLFFDMEARVTYDDKQNEEGLLGLAFHPKYKNNGQFYVYYTSRDEAQLSVISCFKTDAKNHSRADPASEEVLMKVKQPYWNHNGGTLEFGKDGYLYISFGDGGLRDDPLKSAQDLSTVLGKVLRVDVDRKIPGFNYSIPKDNPFVNMPGTRGEIYALGFRNPWRISFDRKTGDLWCSDVGQDLWEEISIISKGGNYGWSKREATHKFKTQGADPSPQYIEPVWEYPHEEGWGKSITGGQVYRGKNVSVLNGYYLYGDYISGRLWALKVDEKTGKTTENREIPWPPSLPVVTFGEDEQGEVYFTTVTSGGRIYRFRPAS